MENLKLKTSFSAINKEKMKKLIGGISSGCPSVCDKTIVVLPPPPPPQKCAIGVTPQAS